MRELRLEAKTENLQEVLDLVDAELETTDCPMKTRMQLEVAVEEIFVNIASYAYAPETGEALIRVETVRENANETEEGTGSAAMIEIVFADKGIPYNPLEKEDPDITLTAEDRKIGGLGIFMVKKSMDEVRYEYKDGQNILCIRKKL